MQINARKYWNLFVIFFIYDYDVKKEQLKKNTNMKR